MKSNHHHHQCWWEYWLNLLSRWKWHIIKSSKSIYRRVRHISGWGHNLRTVEAQSYWGIRRASRRTQKSRWIWKETLEFIKRKGARAFSEGRTACTKACVPESTLCVGISWETQCKWSRGANVGKGRQCTGRVHRANRGGPRRSVCICSQGWRAHRSHWAGNHVINLGARNLECVESVGRELY